MYWTVNIQIKKIIKIENILNTTISLYFNFYKNQKFIKNFMKICLQYPKNETNYWFNIKIFK